MTCTFPPITSLLSFLASFPPALLRFHLHAMELSLEATQKVRTNPPAPWWTHRPASLLEKTSKAAVDFARTAKKIGADDPRRIAHSFKVGLALTLVSVFYFVTPLFHSFGVSAMWAVLTVVVVMEYTVGATLSKGLNRAFATLVAGALGVAAHEVAALCGEKGEPVLLGLFVFMLAATATFSRFIPEIKAKYDYGVTIFILTFILVAVSSFRVEELMELAHQRVSTITIGVATCLATSIFVLPVWAGEDLHHHVAANLENLSSFLQGLAVEHFGEKGAANESNLEGKSFLNAHMSVLNSKATEDTLVNFARWEPCHGRFLFWHPWKQYLKIGALSRQCASCMDVLSTYIAAFPNSKPRTDPDLHLRIQAACEEMSSESAKALKELSSAIRTMTAPSAAASHHVSAAVAAARDLEAAVYYEAAALSDVLHAATTASLLAELVLRTEEIAGSVEELARLARFEGFEPVREAKVKPISAVAAAADDDGKSISHVTITLEEQLNN